MTCMLCVRASLRVSRRNLSASQLADPEGRGQKDGATRAQVITMLRTRDPVRPLGPGIAGMASSIMEFDYMCINYT